MTHADGFRQQAGQTESLVSSSQVVADRNALAIAALQFPFSLCLEFLALTSSMNLLIACVRGVCFRNNFLFFLIASVF
jgi:hypothetical protein